MSTRDFQQEQNGRQLFQLPGVSTIPFNRRKIATQRSFIKSLCFLMRINFTLGFFTKSKKVLFLPFHSNISQNQQRYIIFTINSSVCIYSNNVNDNRAPNLISENVCRISHVSGSL